MYATTLATKSTGFLGHGRPDKQRKTAIAEREK